MIFYQDKKIKIRNVEKEDVVYLFSWSIDQEINKHDPRPLPKNGIELAAECQKFCEKFETEIINEAVYKYFMIIDDSGIPIGFVNLFSINQDRSNGEMGVCIGDKRYWHQGIASKAVDIALDYIFSNLKLKQVYLETNPENIPAIHLAKKCNFQYKGEFMDEDCRFVVMEKNNCYK